MPNRARMEARQDGTRRFGRTSLAAAGTVGLLAAALLAFSAAELPRQQREASRWVEHTLQVLEQAAMLDADLATATSEGRGFLVDRTADSAGRFEDASRQVAGDLAGLRALTADNPARRPALDRLDRLVAGRIDFLREIIARLQAGDEDGATGLVGTHRGRALMDQVRDALGGIRAEEHRLLGTRDKAERRAEWLTVAGLVSCAVLAAASGLFMVVLLVGRGRERAHLAELHESEARFRALFEQSPLLIHVFDAAGQTIAVNPALERAFGVPAQALRDYNVLDDPQPHQNGTRALLERTFAGEVTRTPPIRHDAAAALGQGEALWVEVTGYPVKDAAGWVREVVLLAHDVSERVAAQERAREGELALRGLNEELARRAEEFQTLADNIPTLCWMARADGHIHWYNRRWYDYTGGDPGSQEGWGWEAVHDPDVLPSVVGRWRHSLATGEPFEMTFPLKGADGVFRPFLTRVLPICDAQGRVTRWFGTNTDVTKLREAEQAVARHRDELERLVGERTAALAASEAGYRLLTEHASDMVSRTGPDGSRLYVSPASARIFGVAPEALLGRRLLECVLPDDRPALGACMQRLLAGAVEEDTVVYRVSHPERGQVWVEGVGQVLRDPATGALDGYVAVSRDVTERRAAEAAREESEARYRTLADNTSDAITVLDLDLRRTYASPACRKVFGFEPEEMLGHEPAATAHPDDRDEVYARLRRLVAGEADGERVVNRIRHKQGHLVWVEAGFSLVRDAEGRPASIICAMRDVSERQAQADALQTANAELERLARHLARARDQAERASRAKTRFLAGMSHELRTPLNGILGYAELLRMEGGLNTAQAGRVDAMLGAGQHLLEMINGVLDLSEIEEGHVELRPAVIDLLGIANACLDLVRPAAGAKGLALTLDVAPGTPSSMTADPTRLRQVLLNLLGNAVKFTAEGTVGLRLAAAGDRLRVEVADTGPGIPVERRHQLFQDFERLGAEAGVAEGAGLGLALSARLAALLGGRLGHEDNPGGGSVFRLELPLTAPGAVPAPAAAPAPGLPPASAAAAAQRLRVLVVDDVAMNRDIAGSFLRAAGHEVACADGGAEAAEVADASDFDVILMDVRMPGVDGLEATRRIRALAGPRGRVPIVALTAQAFAEQVSECRKAGMDSHLAKPFTPDALRNAVAQAAAAGPSRGAAGALRRSMDQPMAATGGGPADPAPSAGATPMTPAPGSALPTLDPAAFERTAAFLAPEALASYLRTIAGRGEALLDALRAPGGLAGAGADLAAAAHTLAGSAGMFGFERLATVARQFEHAVQTGAPDAEMLTRSLVAAIKASLLEIPGRVPGGATGEPTRPSRL